MIFSHVGAIVRKHLRPTKDPKQNTEVEQRSTPKAGRAAVPDNQADDTPTYWLVRSLVAIVLLLLIIWLLATWQSVS